MYVAGGLKCMHIYWDCIVGPKRIYDSSNRRTGFCLECTPNQSYPLLVRTPPKQTPAPFHRPEDHTPAPPITSYPSEQRHGRQMGGGRGGRDDPVENAVRNFMPPPVVHVRQFLLTHTCTYKVRLLISSRKIIFGVASLSFLCPSHSSTSYSASTIHRTGI